MAGVPKAYPGDKYGHLTIVEDTGMRAHGGSVVWKFRCDCGNTINRSYDCIQESLIKGCVISCGCMKDKSIGQRLAHDEKRKRLSKESLGQIDGTTMQGICEQKIRKNNKSGVRGVCYKSRNNKWQADISLRGRSVERKLFNTKEEAVLWRKYLEEKYYEPIKEKYSKLKEQDDE